MKTSDKELKTLGYATGESISEIMENAINDNLIDNHTYNSLTKRQQKILMDEVFSYLKSYFNIK